VAIATDAEEVGTRFALVRVQAAQQNRETLDGPEGLEPDRLTQARWTRYSTLSSPSKSASWVHTVAA